MVVLMPGTTESMASACAEGCRGARRGPTVSVVGPARRARLASRTIHAALSFESRLCSTVNPSSTNRHTAPRHASSLIRGSPSMRRTACGNADCKRTAWSKMRPSRIEAPRSLGPLRSTASPVPST